jgi:hypothetical protein
MTETPEPLAEVNPERMALVDRTAERDAVENRIHNRKNLVDLYECAACSGGFATVAVSAGAVPFAQDCETAGCGGYAELVTGQPKGAPFGRGEKSAFEAAEEAAGRTRAEEFDGEIDFEWYRPLTEDECEVAVSLAKAEADARSHDPRIPADQRPFYAALALRDEARALLEGKLLRRPKVSR